MTDIVRAMVEHRKKHEPDLDVNVLLRRWDRHGLTAPARALRRQRVDGGCPAMGDDVMLTSQRDRTLHSLTRAAAIVRDDERTRCRMKATVLGLPYAPDDAGRVGRGGEHLHVPCR